MPTEFMTYRQIKRKFGFVSELIDPKYSIIHSKGLKLGEVTTLNSSFFDIVFV